MARLPYSLIHCARQIDPLLIPLVRVCRDLPSALNELRWLKQHAESLRPNTLPSAIPSLGYARHRLTLQSLCEARGRGVPLQYLLGTEYFGELELFVKPGVLIPRWETASAICHLSGLLQNNSATLRQSLKNHSSRGPSSLQVLDLCTGTGCIPLLFQHQLKVTSRALGVDISPEAIALARKNARHIRALQNFNDENSCQFVLGDIMSSKDEPHDAPSLQHVLNSHCMHEIDIVVSNPPYISPSYYRKHTERSVRNYEPQIALVPSVHRSSTETSASADELQGDAFYPRLLDVTSSLIRPSIFWCEVGDLNQAIRVASMAFSRGDWDGVEIWRDEPKDNAVGRISIHGQEVRIVGQGHGRSVLCWRGDGASWLKSL